MRIGILWAPERSVRRRNTRVPPTTLAGEVGARMESVAVPFIPCRVEIECQNDPGLSITKAQSFMAPAEVRALEWVDRDGVEPATGSGRPAQVLGEGGDKIADGSQGRDLVGIDLHLEVVLKPENDRDQIQ
jgi:hypothetical protein